MENITFEAEEAARNQHMKTLYGFTKILCNENPKQSTAVLDKNGNLSTKEEVQARWTEHFKEVLNRGESENPVLSDDVYELELSGIIEEISVSEPTLGEVKQAVKRLKNGKAPGTDSITAEVLKANIEFSATKIHQLLGKVCTFEKIPQPWKQGLIKLPKKGNLKECKNSRGITLLSVVGKVLGKIIIERVRNGVEGRLRKEQAGYRKGRNKRSDLHPVEHY